MEPVQKKGVLNDQGGLFISEGRIGDLKLEISEADAKWRDVEEVEVLRAAIEEAGAGQEEEAAVEAGPRH